MGMVSLVKSNLLMGFACNEMKYQQQLAVVSLLLLLSLGSHQLMAVRPTGVLSDTQLTEVPGENWYMVSDIEPQEMPGENGCRLNVSWSYNQYKPIKVVVQNLCKVCESVQPDLLLFHSDGRGRFPFNISGTIEPGKFGVRYLDLNVEVYSLKVTNPNFSCK